MKRRNIEELKSKSAGDLASSIAESKSKLRMLRLDLAAGKVKNVRELRALRKNIARMLTFLKQETMKTK